MFNHDESTIKILIDFVEGKLDINAFKYQFDNNESVKKVLQTDPLFSGKISQHIDYTMGTKQKNLIQFLITRNWETRSDQLNIWGELERFLSRYNYTYVPTKYYEDRFDFLLDIQPRWLSIFDESFLAKEVMDKIPAELKSKKEKIKWCKERLKELFRYEKVPPKWVQSPEWPIINGKPLIFCRQSKETLSDEQVYYYFYDVNTKEEHTIVQLY